MNSYYRVEPHWHVYFGRTETLIYSESSEEIAEWVRQQAVLGNWIFERGLDPRDYAAFLCGKNDCRPRPRRVDTLEEFLQHPSHGWWRRISLDDLGVDRIVATVTKYRCDFCKREVEDTHLEPGWIQIHGNLTRSWGTRKRGRDGDAQSDFLKDEEFCNVTCLVAKLDALRKEKRGPELRPPTPVVDAVDPFKDPPKKQPFEDPFPELLEEDVPPNRK